MEGLRGETIRWVAFAVADRFLQGGSSAADLERSINEEWQRLNPEFA